MNTPIEHQDFAVLALYLVPGFMVCEARAIADGWSGHGSPPTRERDGVGDLTETDGGRVLAYTFLQKQTFGFDAQQNRASNVEKRGSLDGAEELTQTGR